MYHVCDSGCFEHFVYVVCGHRRHILDQGISEEKRQAEKGSPIRRR